MVNFNFIMLLFTSQSLDLCLATWSEIDTPVLNYTDGVLFPAVYHHKPLYKCTMTTP